jgi:hypothetical protein
MLAVGWRLLHSPCCERDAQGWFIHETLTNWTTDEDLTMDDRILCLPPRIQEGAAHGTEIKLHADQLLVLDHLAQAGQTELVGILSFHANPQIEYWLPIQLNPIADEPLGLYLTQLQAQWLTELEGLAPIMAQYF